MKIVAPSVEILRTGLETEATTPEEFIEKVGRTCYKSEDKITNDSAAKFVANLIKRGHEAMIEHWSLIFRTTPDWYEEIISDQDLLMHNCAVDLKEPLRPYLRFTDWQTADGEARCIVSGNMRAWRDYAKACVNGFGFMPQYMYGLIRNYPLFFPEYQDYVPAIINNYILIPMSASELVSDKERGTHMTVTVKIICDRGVTHELVRHRVASFAQESTRYCNYSGDKFGGGIAIVEPRFMSKAHAAENQKIIDVCNRICEQSEQAYLELLELGCTPQEARFALITGLKAEIIVTMTLNDWAHFFGLRCAPTAHPDMQEVAKMAEDLFDIVVFPEIDEAVDIEMDITPGVSECTEDYLARIQNEINRSIE